MLRAKKQLREHQKAALKDVTQGLAEADRGKLIMACGTGKTFTALRIAEAMAPAGHVLFLVPSLLSQSLREWTAEALVPLHSLAVCSDVNIGKSRKKADDDGGDITLHDLAFPATTNARQLFLQYEALKKPVPSLSPQRKQGGVAGTLACAVGSTGLAKPRPALHACQLRPVRPRCVCR